MSSNISSSLTPKSSGRIILDTQLGAIEIDLYANECPKHVKYFLHCGMAGYYDGSRVSRVEPGFMAVFGHRASDDGVRVSDIADLLIPQRAEYNARLRFTQRGLVAIAYQPSYKSQSITPEFFITFAPCQHLNNQHVIIGQVVGDSIYNVLKLEQYEINDSGELVYPVLLHKFQVIDNPFKDLKVTRYFNQQQSSKSDSKSRKVIDNGGDASTLLSFNVEHINTSGVIKKKRILSNSSRPIRQVPTSNTDINRNQVAIQERFEKQNQQLPDEKVIKESSEYLSKDSSPIAETPAQLDESKSVTGTQQITSATQSDYIQPAQSLQKVKRKSQFTLAQLNQQMLSQQQKSGQLMQGRSSKTASKREQDVLDRLSNFRKKLKPSAVWQTQSQQEDSDDLTSNALHKETCQAHGIPSCGSCFKQGDYPGSQQAQQGGIDKAVSFQVRELKFEKDLTGKSLLDPMARNVENVDDLVVIDTRTRRNIK
ncbi:hypothetical protein MIR68_008075 [Amoeboaphelidium protococcarum]|nr:hypothetical protein MIR68_008075 [Amoeboaphelidium protococcarum]